MGRSSADFAAYTQEVLRQTLDPGNARQASKAPNTVYLLDHVTCRAILVECGFLSNPEERTPFCRPAATRPRSPSLWPAPIWI